MDQLASITDEIFISNSNSSSSHDYEMIASDGLAAAYGVLAVVALVRCIHNHGGVASFSYCSWGCEGYRLTRVYACICAGANHSNTDQSPRIWLDDAEGLPSAQLFGGVFESTRLCMPS